MRPCPCGRIIGIDLPRQFMPAEDSWSRTARAAPRSAGPRPHRAGLGAVVEERVEPAAGALKHRLDQSGDRFRSWYSPSGNASMPSASSGGEILLLAHGREYPPAIRLQRAGAMGADAGGAAGDDDGGFCRPFVRMFPVQIGHCFPYSPLTRQQTATKRVLGAAGAAGPEDGCRLHPSYGSCKVVFDAFWHFIEDDGWAMASHVALSTCWRFSLPDLRHGARQLSRRRPVLRDGRPSASSIPGRDDRQAARDGSRRRC